MKHAYTNVGYYNNKKHASTRETFLTTLGLAVLALGGLSAVIYILYSAYTMGL